MADGTTPASVNQTPLPPAIAKAIIEAIEKIELAVATGEGEDVDRKFRYISINDVLEVTHQPLKDAKLAVIPIESSCTREVLGTGLGGALQLWTHYGYQFRLVHGTGAVWLEERDTRHISVVLSANGMSAGKAQSLALRDYLKGLFRIRTEEPAEEDEASQKQNVSRETIAKQGSAPRKKRGQGPTDPKDLNIYPFDFGPSRGMAGLTAAEVKETFDATVAPLKAALRKQWEEANLEGLKSLHEADKSTWLHIRKGLDATE